jgi:hypothetical protein
VDLMVYQNLMNTKIASALAPVNGQASRLMGVRQPVRRGQPGRALINTGSPAGR